jgi:hypothetical protein
MEMCTYCLYSLGEHLQECWWFWWFWFLRTSKVLVVLVVLLFKNIRSVGGSFFRTLKVLVVLCFFLRTLKVLGGSVFFFLRTLKAWVVMFFQHIGGNMKVKEVNHFICLKWAYSLGREPFGLYLTSDMQ